MYRFAGFELDLRRAELRGPDGAVIKLRPKTYEMLKLFAANAGRVVSKQELMQGVWPNVYVGEDNLFQCIREIRTALGDERRQMLKVVSGRGYLFDAEVTDATQSAHTPGDTPAALPPAPAVIPEPAARRLPFGLRAPAIVAIVAVLGAVIGLAVATPIFAPGIAGKRATTLTVVPTIDASGDPQGAAVAADFNDGLIKGLTQIENIRVVAKPEAQLQTVAARSDDTEFLVQTELGRDGPNWTLRARLIRPATGHVERAISQSVNAETLDAPMQRSRLVAGIGHPLAVHINTLVESGARPPANGSTGSLAAAKAAIEQATASINQTSRDRFAGAQMILEQGLAAEPDNIDIAVALAALKLRGIQMVWYSEAESAEAEKTAKAALERAQRIRPNHIPVLEAYCRFLNATNHFVESLVACARALSFDPWNGLALYHLGLAKIQLGRFEEALDMFRTADSFDTPQVSRWTWLLGAGWANLLLNRGADAVPWLERSIAITPASGRSYYLLAAAYQFSGRPDEAKAALARGSALRPGTNAENIRTPIKNVAPEALAAGQNIIRTLVAIGMPEK